VSTFALLCFDLTWFENELRISKFFDFYGQNWTLNPRRHFKENKISLCYDGW
jgi:hypothetical protein